MDYKNGKIYIIRNTVNNLCYVGSTTQPLAKRLSKHRGDSNSLVNVNRKLYKAMKEVGKDKFYIELLENFPCSSKEELTAREGYFIREQNTFNSGYNCLVNGRSQKEYHVDNIEQIKEKNKEKIICECGCEILKTNSVRHINTNTHFQYLFSNNLITEEEYNNKIGQIVKENTKRNSKYTKVKILCECGSLITKVKISRHQKSEKHLNYLNSLENKPEENLS